MIKTYRLTQQWNRWLSQPLGMQLLEAEKQYLSPFLTDCYGKFAILIGVPTQLELLQVSSIAFQVLVGPLITRVERFIESEFETLPIASASVDLVLLPHTLEHVKNPQELLHEACRIVKPEGFIFIFGLNPYSLWGLKKKLTKEESIPWTSNFISANTIKKWLKLVDFELIKHETLVFRPPVEHDRVYQKLKLMEWLGRKCVLPFGGVYAIMAKAKVTPLTPIRLHWKQQFTGAHISLTNPTLRN